MIDKIKLLKVKKIVLHKFCHDGLASGMIIKDVLHDVEYFFADHKDSEYLNIKAEPGLLFCDISPPPGREAEFFWNESIVLDHHEGTKDIVLKFQNAGLGVYGEIDEGISGALLAYKYVWLPLEAQFGQTDFHKIKQFAERAAIRDCWKINSPEWLNACYQTDTLNFYPEKYFMENHHACILDHEMEIGKISYEKYQENLKYAISNCVIKKWKDELHNIDLNYGIIPGHRIISDCAEILRKDNVNILFAFSFKIDEDKNPYLACSIRSDGSFDCNKFASFHGGKGHKKSAGGIKIDLKSYNLNPYYIIELILNKNGPNCVDIKNNLPEPNLATESEIESIKKEAKIWRAEVINKVKDIEKL